MKQKDLLLIGAIVLISAIFSLVVSKIVFGGPKNHQQQAEIVQVVSSEFPEPNKAYFNKDSINPTKLITIGQSNNPAPFKSTSGQ